MHNTDIAGVVMGTIQLILPHVPESEILGSVHLSDLGADSVDRVEIMSTILQQLGADIPLFEFSKFKNINQMVGFLEKEMKG
ncbi:hypothetical protein J7384_05550 [Endozoicomonas sp. G2_1]|uniref:phosphopantetheine-binding protein n=1 Tax=Endozoicomonas sp. G2_1 TaxID=2821091 RepID=UPI001ADBB925|nr:phosphopantetheine-binding protein [Endozoicomonas sp. G2_1]MBO9489820.1 hypothetical protein [Endozoicomonas sp. G2_1]